MNIRNYFCIVKHKTLKFMEKDFSWIWGVLYILMIALFLVWAFNNPPSFNDWWDSTRGILPSYP